MKIKKIAVAALVPAAVAGVTVSSWAAVQAATSHPSARAAAHQAREVHPGHPVHRVQPPAHKARHAAHGRAGQELSQARTASAGHKHAHHGAKAHHRVHAKAAAPAAQPAAPLTSGMSAFEQCVAWRESGDNPTASSSGLFGILPATWASLGYPGTAGGSSVALQKAAFDKLYAQYGTSPWAPYDGC